MAVRYALIRFLNMFYISQYLTDVSIQVLAFNCQLLRRVSLAACPLIGDGAAKYLSQGCTWIEYIDLSGTVITYVFVLC